MSTKKLSQKYSNASLVVYISLFFIVWYFCLMIIKAYRYSFILFIPPYSIAVMEHIIKLMIWVLPVFVYIKVCDNENPLTYLKLIFNGKKGVIWGAFGIILFIIYNLIGTFIEKGFIYFHFNFDINILIGFIVAGFTEEILFRGFIQQKVNQLTKFWVANIITSVLFLLVHVIGWVFFGHKVSVISSIFIFVFSLIVGYVYKKSGTLWSVILIHIIHNSVGLML